jgi:hypothetical protein
MSLKHRAMIVNSYFGLDKAVALPPNVTLTGPLVKMDASLLTDLAQKAPDISKFLDDAESAKEKVIVISLGTMLNWSKWAVDAIIEGVNELNKTHNLKVLWSMPEADHNLLPSDLDKSTFLVNKFIPQVEALNHPAVAVGMLHCGFGATLEAIGAGKPVLAWPGFGDQPMNADMLVALGMSEILAGSATENNDMDYDTLRFHWPDPVFDSAKLVTLLGKLLSDEKYTLNAQKQQVISRMTGGSDAAVKAVEAAYLQYGGSGQKVLREGCELQEPSLIVDNDFYKMTPYLSFCKCCCMFACIIPALILYLALAGFPGLMNMSAEEAV